MLVLTLARKPCSECSVAANALQFGAGGLNIDRTRIAAPLGDEPVINPIVTGGRRGVQNYSGGDFPRITERHQTEGQKIGRWPANLILGHAPDCRMIGTRTDTQPEGGGYSDEAGLETVESWDCQQGCPVADLDQQSGPRKAGGVVRGTEPSYTGQNGIYGTWGRIHNISFQDEGGASRFFKQVGNHKP